MNKQKAIGFISGLGFAAMTSCGYGFATAQNTELPSVILESQDISWARATYPTNTTGVIDAVIKSDRTCLNLRSQSDLEKILKCVPNGTSVQVWLEKDKSIEVRDRKKFSYVFVLLFDGSKGWIEVSSLVPNTEGIEIKRSDELVNPAANTAMYLQPVSTEATACVSKLKQISQIANN